MKLDGSATVRYDEALTDAALEAARKSWEANGWYMVRVETSTDYVSISGPKSASTIKGSSETVVYLESRVAS